MIAALATVLAGLQHAASVLPGDSDVPIVHVTRDNTVIDRTCSLVIDPAAVIEDSDGNGVIHIAADNITVSFADGSRLVAGEFDGRWNALSGSGVRIDGRKNVTLKGARVSGCKVGIWATNADGLTIDGAELSDNFRQHLGSKPWAEDSADWLWPHENDKREWATNYGAALLVERSDNVTLHDVTVRRGQNGIMLDRVNDSKVYDNDCSFLSGWGLSMWRSNRNTISRNAFDFCVRGHSEGVYNRGQDSAGILCFEQCSNNTFIWNSATHGGDGFFGFAGKEAIGEREPVDGPIDLANAGCNDNTFLFNDFSYAPAHGWEMTFSLRNLLFVNTFIENGVCGIWGGYSNDTIICSNHFERNGGLAYGMERGAINIEHGSGNLILKNSIHDNRVGIHIWLDADTQLRELPGVKARYRGVTDNRLVWNEVTISAQQPFGELGADRPLIGVQVRRVDGAPGPLERNSYVGNYISDFDAAQTKELDLTAGVQLARENASPMQFSDRVKYMKPGQIINEPGTTQPVNARQNLAGRASIIMDEWGPWDHASPMVRLGQRSARGVVYEVRGTSANLYAENLLTGEKEYWPATPTALEPLKLTIAGDGGYTEYAYRLVDGDWSKELRGSIVQAQWTTTFFKNATDPRTDEPGWRAAATGPDAVTVTLPAIDLPFGYNGPARTVRLLDPEASKPLADAKFKANQFGLVASTTIHLPAGQWKLVVESDDGVRLRADGRTVIENWTLHGPARDEAVLTLTEARETPLELTYFQLEGFAVLRLGIERAAATTE
ncbi:MAG TPA: right-handed parallel beta-helix repeat-containing protein [Phycisphaerales bacterium]|nr:right-handed parallel beta-helix repeat-containing protein [Phycisphaerales bacterium]